MSLDKLFKIYAFGQSETPYSKDDFAIENYYDAEELNELEMEKDSSENFRSEVLNLSTNWDTFNGSMRNSCFSFFDSLFSSLGSGISQNLSTKPKLTVNLLTFLSSVLTNQDSSGFFNKKISLFKFGGRLIRSPLHILDSFFSVMGESLSKTSTGALSGLGLGAAGLGLSFLEKGKAVSELDYQRLSGNLGRSALHNFQSLSSSLAQNIYKASPLLGSLLTIAAPFASQALPDELKKHNIDWKALSGVLSQNLFAFTDTLSSNFGRIISDTVINKPFLGLGSAIVGLASLLSPQAKSLLDTKLIYTQLDSKILRSALHSLDSIALNLGTSFAKNKSSSLFLAAYALVTMNSSLIKNSIIPKVPDFKISMNKVSGLLQRLSFDFIEALISEKSNKLSDKIPSVFLAILGPALSFKIGEMNKEAKTNYNSSQGLMLKHLIHFWDNLLTSAGYKTGKAINSFFKLCDTEHSGTMMTDGRWLTNNGRIVANMALGKQLAI